MLSRHLERRGGAQFGAVGSDQADSRGGHATASNLLILASGLIGGALAPVLVGMIGGQLVPRFGADALRYALIAVPIAAVLAGGAFLMANRHLANDLYHG